MIPTAQKRRPGESGVPSKINGHVDDPSLGAIAHIGALTLATETGRLSWRHRLRDGRLLLITAHVVADDGDHDPAVLLQRVDQAEQMRRRAIREALQAGQAATWERRAEVLDWARPRPTDYTGQATEAQLRLRDRRLAEDAVACREHAAVLSGRWVA